MYIKKFEFHICQLLSLSTRSFYTAVWLKLYIDVEELKVNGTKN